MESLRSLNPYSKLSVSRGQGPAKPGEVGDTDLEEGAGKAWVQGLG